MTSLLLCKHTHLREYLDVRSSKCSKLRKKIVGENMSACVTYLVFLQSLKTCYETRGKFNANSNLLLPLDGLITFYQ